MRRAKKSPVDVFDKKTKEFLWTETRGRSKREDWFMDFNVRKYKADVSIALRAALIDVRNEMVARMRIKVVTIPFRDRSISMADGSVTSDLERKAALIQSIVGSKIDGSLRDGIMSVAVTAMEDNLKDSHVGFYYEYGTGTQEEQDSPYYLWGEWNTYRGAQIPGQPIVTRRAGSYVDAGGNIRISNARHPGMPITTPGWEIEAHRWFRETFDEMYDDILRRLKDALYSINPFDSKYFRVNPKIKINLVRKGG